MLAMPLLDPVVSPCLLLLFSMQPIGPKSARAHIASVSLQCLGVLLKGVRSTAFSFAEAMELREVEMVGILVLQGITAASAGATILHSVWQRQVPEALTQLQSGICCLRERIVPKPKPGDVRVMEQFHLTLCRLLVTGCRAVVVVLFLRLLAIQGPLIAGQRHHLTPAIDVSNLLAYPIVLFLVLFSQVITPRSIDAWYVLLQSLSVLPVVLTEAADTGKLSLITLLPRVLLGLCPKRGWLPFFGNLVQWVLVGAGVQFKLSSDIFLAQTAEFAWLCVGVYSLRHTLYENVRMTLDLKTRTIDLSAVSALLLGFCDAVIEVDHMLRLTDDSRQFSTLLLHGHGISAGSLTGSEFLTFFHHEDRQRIFDALTDCSSMKPLALNARMLDCLGNSVKVEILYTSFHNAGGEECLLIGMREFQDFQDFGTAAAPSTARASPPAHLPIEEASIVFDATSFDILSMSAAFKKFCCSAFFN